MCGRNQNTGSETERIESLIKLEYLKLRECLMLGRGGVQYKLSVEAQLLELRIGFLIKADFGCGRLHRVLCF